MLIPSNFDNSLNYKKVHMGSKCFLCIAQYKGSTIDRRFAFKSNNYALVSS